MLFFLSSAAQDSRRNNLARSTLCRTARVERIAVLQCLFGATVAAPYAHTHTYYNIIPFRDVPSDTVLYGANQPIIVQQPQLNSLWPLRACSAGSASVHASHFARHRVIIPINHHRRRLRRLYYGDGIVVVVADAV